MTHDMCTWHVKCDMSYVTCDMLHVVGSEHSLKMLAFMVWERQCFEDILTKDDSLTNLIYQLITKLFVEKTHI